MRALFLLLFSTLLLADQCDEPVMKFEAEHGKIEISILDKTGRIPFSLKKDTRNICKAFITFSSKEENTILYKKLLKEKYKETDASPERFLKFFLEEKRPEAFLEMIIRENFDKAKEDLTRQTYMFD